MPWWGYVVMTALNVAVVPFYVFTSKRVSAHVQVSQERMHKGDLRMAAMEQDVAERARVCEERKAWLQRIEDKVDLGNQQTAQILGHLTR